MAIAEAPSVETIRREAMASEFRRHESIICLFSDPEVVESLRVALAEERRNEEVPLEELRRKYGKRRRG